MLKYRSIKKQGLLTNLKGIFMKSIAKQFLIDGNIIEIKPHLEGHINDTYYIKTDENNTYVMQRINHLVFNDVDKLMSNIEKITGFLSNYHVHNGDPNVQVLMLILTKHQKSYYYDQKNYYRMYEMIKNAISFQEVPHIDYMERTGIALGKFQLMLNDFNIDDLFETIPDFHHTEKRYHNLENAISKAEPKRIERAQSLIDQIVKRKHYTETILKHILLKEIPIRVTHNDTKLNNILFDKDTGHPICLIDFDTVMPGSALYDFGDAVRFACNTAAEDASDLSLVKLNMDYFEAFTKGYLNTVGACLTPKELELLAFSPILITYELSMRFLEDYLRGNHYFKTTYQTHNLVRAKNQFALVCEMEKNYEKMKEIVKQYQ